MSNAHSTIDRLGEWSYTYNGNNFSLSKGEYRINGLLVNRTQFYSSLEFEKEEQRQKYQVDTPPLVAASRVFNKDITRCRNR